MRMGIRVGVIVLGLCCASVARAQGPGFTQEDRDRLIRLETTLQVFMHQVDKRFEQVDKRIQELREDMNKRFEQVDKRFEQVDRRFEQVDRRFEQIMTFLWILVAIFTTLTATVIGFAYWDRRTIIRKARDEAVEQIEKEGRLRDLIQAMRALAPDNPSVAEVLRRFHLL
jgi:hypothetical protein